MGFKKKKKSQIPEIPAQFCKPASYSEILETRRQWSTTRTLYVMLKDKWEIILTKKWKLKMIYENTHIKLSVKVKLYWLGACG